MNIKSIYTFGIFICLILPKINIVNIHGFHQGIRFEDIFLSLCLLSILLNNNISLKYIPNKSLYFFFYFYVLIFGIISYYSTNIFSLLLPLRWIEYSVYYLIISQINISLKDIRYIIIGYITLNLFVVILQYNQLVGGIYSHGYFPDVYGRISGLTGGSWELPAMLAMFVCTSITDEYYEAKKILLALIIMVTSLMVYFAGTRVGMIAYIVSIGFVLIKKYRLNIFSIIAVCIISLLFINQDRVNPYLKTGKLPYSMEIRLTEWNKYFIEMDMYNYIYGKGLGFTGLYADGMFVKIFIDMGIIGLIIYSLFYIRLLYPYKVIGLIVLLYCISIDFFTASKLMFGMYLSIYYIKKQKIKLNYSKLYNKYKYYHEHN